MNAETMATVLRVACLTEDRDGSEQRAMLDLALYLDAERGRFSSGNRHPVAPTLVAIVEETYDPSEGRRIELTAAQRTQYDRMLRQWVQCGKCKHPMGAHYLHDACPTTPHDLAWLAEAGL
jgi:hypothetical protein